MTIGTILITGAQRRAEERGPYADPWTLIAKKYGSAALAD
jgi:D-erythronate 2-dehydrogenase